MERIAMKDPRCTCTWTIIHMDAPAQRTATNPNCPAHTVVAVGLPASTFCTVPVAVTSACGHPPPIDPQSQYICGQALPCQTHPDGHIAIENLGGL